jgi:PadR family transcriptional regulator, regulatory protein PadR
LAPNQIFFEMVERGKGKGPNPNHRGQAAFEGLSRLSSKIVIHFHLDILGKGEILSPRMSTKEARIELLQGTLDLLILRTLLLGPAHGHAIAKAIEMRSQDVLQVEQGSLYPALHRLIKRGWISVQDGTSENNRRAKFYRLTAKGRRQLAVEASKWDRLAGAIARILMPAEQEGKS